MSSKVILYIAISLDGFIAREDGDVSWLSGDGSEKEANNSYEEFIKNIDTIIMGRKTYDRILDGCTPDYWPYEGLKCYVYTNSEVVNNDNVEFTNVPVKVLVEELKRKCEKDIWLVGGGELINEFIMGELIDEYIISIVPVILGHGIKLFSENNGVIKLKYLSNRFFDGIGEIHYTKR